MTEPRFLTLKEIDTQWQAPKGTAFRAFKKLEPQLQEGADYQLLRAETHPAELAQLRQSNRLYLMPPNALLIASHVVAHMALTENLPTPKQS